MPCQRNMTPSAGFGDPFLEVKHDDWRKEELKYSSINSRRSNGHVHAKKRSPAICTEEDATTSVSA